MNSTRVILQPSRDLIRPYAEDLWADYREYCLTVSRRGMAASIESCAYLWWLCDTVDARTVADCGSGFSSYTLRRYAQGKDVEVVSVDDSPEWLARTAEFLTGHHLPATGLVGPVEWAANDLRFDVVFYDYSGGDAREENMALAASKVADGGVIVFDDAQHAGHYKRMTEVCRDERMHLFDVRSQSADEVGRFAAMGVR